MRSGTKSIWKKEAEDLLRGFSGAFLFGVPLLYTMEVWWKGNYTSPPRMLASLAIGYMALVALTYVAGFKAERAIDWSRIFSDSAEALAIALVASTLSLFLIGVLNWDMGLEPMMGQIILESIPFGIGVGVSNFLMRPDGNGRASAKEGEEKKPKQPEGPIQGTLADMGATALGATIIAFSIAPTEEVEMIASTLSSFDLIVFMAASLVLSYVIVFEASFTSQKKRRDQRGVFQHPLSETVACYVVSLFMAVFMLWVFQQLGGDDSLEKWLTHTLVLGFPAAIGGAAGRLTV